MKRQVGEDRIGLEAKEAPMATGRQPLLEVEHVKQYFPIKSGVSDRPRPWGTCTPSTT